METRRIIGTLFVLAAMAGSCVTEIEPESIGYDRLLVVEGLITNQATRQVIKLSYTTEINSDVTNPLSGAIVTVETENQGVVSFNEEEPGRYTTTFPFAAIAGLKYRLKIATEDGLEYESDEVVMTPTPPIDRLYGEFVPDVNPPVSPEEHTRGFFNFYMDVTNNTTSTGSMRVLWSEAYRIKVPNPSRWRWLGGDNFEFRLEDFPELQEEYCFRHDTTTQITLAESLASNGELVRFPVHSFRARRQLNLRYTIEVVQYGLSEEAKRFWKNLQISSQTQGSLFDVQPGTVTGNIRSVTDPRETVLGIFEVAEEQRLRVFYRASDFFSQGFANYDNNWIVCDQEVVTVPEPEAGAFMRENNERYELLYYISGGGGAVFGLKHCALCTLYGTNVEPDFWVD